MKEVPLKVEAMLNHEAKFFDRKYRRAGFRPDDLKIDVKTFLEEQTYIFNGGSERGHAIGFALDLLLKDGILDKTICDYACGTGTYGVLFALLGANVYGFDISIEGVRVANLRAQVNGCSERAKFQVMSASNLGYHDRTFDYVFGEASLHHTHKYQNIEVELFRILREGGRAIFRESLGHNPFIEGARLLTLVRGGAFDAGETNLKYEDIFRVGRNFRSIHTYEMGLLFMSKRIFRGNFDRPLVRPVLKSLKRFDDILINRVPALKKFCGEVVIEYVK